ncbi:protein yippee-like 2 isoform X1 [Struthio camelus]|uniref:protein yippee-like 2 isoform X1 n=1 Tax=Struthio camelus TaxID=8801 RepID=UPI0036041FA3
MNSFPRELPGTKDSESSGFLHLLQILNNWSMELLRSEPSWVRWVFVVGPYSWKRRKCKQARWLAGWVNCPMNFLCRPTSREADWRGALSNAVFPSFFILKSSSEARQWHQRPSKITRGAAKVCRVLLIY